MAKRIGLGKGIDTLIPDKENSRTATKEKIVEKIVEKEVETKIKLTEIEPNRAQPRRNFDEDSLMELSDSIKQYGLIQPIVVQKRDGYYEIIAGERRWRASKMAGLKEIPVIIKEYSNEEIVEIALIENIQREELNPIEEAMAYKRLLKEFNLKQDEIADKVCKSRAAITNSMRLLKLPEEIQQMIVDEKISSGHGRALLAITDVNMQLKLAEQFFDNNLSVREAERLVRLANTPKPEKKKAEYGDEFVYKSIEKTMQEIIGSNVLINRKNKDKGKIEIEYYSKEELERIVEMLNTLRNKE